MSKLSGFEEKLVQVVNQHQPEYDPQSWEQLSKQLPANGGGVNTSLVAGIAAAAALAAGVFFYVEKSDIGLAHQALDSQSLVFKNADLVRISKNEPTADYIADLIQEPAADQNPEAAANNDDSSSEDLPVNRTAANAVVTETNDLIEITPTHAAPPANSKRNISSMAAFSMSSTAVCEGEEVVFELNNAPVEGNYLWNFGDGDFDSRQTPSHVFHKAGTYSVSLSVTTKKDGVIHHSPIQSSITVKEKPNAAYSTEPMDGSLAKSKLLFQNKSTKTDECLWIVQGDESTEINPTFEFEGKGKYLVKLYVESENGCSDSLFNYVEVKDELTMGAPKSFDPNSGETFMPNALTDASVNFRLTIYDQKEAIFETVSAHSGWDGTDTKGNLVDSGKDYTWVVILLENGKEKSAFSGRVKVQP